MIRGRNTPFDERKVLFMTRNKMRTLKIGDHVTLNNVCKKDAGREAIVLYITHYKGEYDFQDDCNVLIESVDGKPFNSIAALKNQWLIRFSYLNTID